jgi:hypothetical protein
VRQRLSLLASPVFLILLLGGCALTVALGRLLFTLNIDAEPNTVEINVAAPETAVAPGEPFTVRVSIRNFLEEEQTLHSIDISDAYLQAIPLQSSRPAFDRETTIPLVDFQSFFFDQPLRPGGTLNVELDFVAAGAGEVNGELDVCINAGGSCKLFPLTTLVE